MDTEFAVLPLVLMYHSVEPYEADPYQVTVQPQRFERQLDWLRRHGRRGVAMRELLRERAPDMVGLTFDDGYRDFLTGALPALRAYGFTATVFVVAGGLGRHNAWDDPGPRKPLMSADDVRAVAAAGMEIGSHTLSHVRLPEVPDAVLADEVDRSRGILVGITGEAVAGFCYPYGAAGAREIEAVRAAGYDYGCAVHASPLAGRHALPRTFVGDRDGPARLLAKLIRHRLTTARAAR